MNVLKPELVWIDGRCYRLLGNTEWSKISNIAPYVDDDYQIDYKNTEEYKDSEIEIVPHGSTTFKHTFHVAKSFFPFIVGSKHAVRKRLETETRTVIQIPRPGQDGNIVIIGSDEKGIVTARNRIHLLMESTRKRLQATHFLSIPLNEGHIIMKFNAFKNDVLTNYNKTCRGIDETIFQLPSKLHLTLGMLTLLDEEERGQAIEALNYCKEHIIKPAIKRCGQVSISIQGTDVMNDDPSEVKVLYAKVVDKSNALQGIVNEIVNYYASIGLMCKTGDNVKLHVTFMNTRFKLQDEEENIQHDATFDATEILKAHESTAFGETTLKQIHISQRHTISNTGYYQATAKINLFDDL